MLRHLARLLCLLLLTAVFTACHTAQKYAESGDYDAAIDFCVRKLRGKSNKKEEYVRILETAFSKAQQRDLRSAEALARENRPENAVRINELHRDIRERQAKVRPLTQLKSKKGYRAEFTFVNIEQLESESRRQAADYLYTHAQDLLEKAQRNQDRQAARDAYATLEDLENRYFHTYREKDDLKKQARALGTTHVLFEVKNQSDKVLPRAFMDQVLAISQSDLNSAWKTYHFKSEPGLSFDYKVIFNVTRVDISPERVKEREYWDEKEIKDGWEYVLDAKGNVLKDSLGNDVKRPRLVRVRANVLEVLQTKATRLTGRVEVFDADKNNRLDSRDLGTEVLFEHYASTFKGDERALSEASRARIGCAPVPFPLDGDMLVQAAERLKPELRRGLAESRVIF